jgi:hypothetical protein
VSYVCLCFNFKAFFYTKLYTSKFGLLDFEYLGQFASGSWEIFTGYSENDGEQYVGIRFSLNSLSFFFVNRTIKLQLTHIYIPPKLFERFLYLSARKGLTTVNIIDNVKCAHHKDILHRLSCISVSFLNL